MTPQTIRLTMAPPPSLPVCLIEVCGCTVVVDSGAPATIPGGVEALTNDKGGELTVDHLTLQGHLSCTLVLSILSFCSAATVLTGNAQPQHRKLYSDSDLQQTASDPSFQAPH